ncbi:hypothetical protein O1611_g4604 [Lasiodiplodia mahajangana]|uniref:Uncharacterized protein n=1 Tax=Lasiodiplodia mahajangana TaxID=1108764 RepID=A0ACC2JNL6_9PEZI|nr:hypothetical protein O1611_g4604 [Lasiodiplodia mahajangana]
MFVIQPRQPFTGAEQSHISSDLQEGDLSDPKYIAFELVNGDYEYYSHAVNVVAASYERVSAKSPLFAVREDLPSRSVLSVHQHSSWHTYQAALELGLGKGYSEVTHETGDCLVVYAATPDKAQETASVPLFIEAPEKSAVMRISGLTSANVLF